MFTNKKIYWLSALVLVLAFAFVQQQVFAQWAGPTAGPSGTDNLDFLTNPLTEDLNFGGHALTAGGAVSGTSGTFSGAVSGTNAIFSGLITGNSANISGNLNAVTINGQTPVFGGGVKNPLEANLSGADRYGLVNLKGCDPAKSTSCAAVSATAGRSAYNDSFAHGVFGQTAASSANFPSYGVYGLALNTGGVGVTGYSTPANAIGVYGVAQNVSGIAAMFYNQAAGGKALVTSGLTELNGNLNVIGNADVSNNLNVNQDLTVSDDLVVTGTTLLEGLVQIDNGVTVEGIMRVDASPVSSFSAIVGIADGLSYGTNAGVEGIGTVGVYGNGSLVGVYADSPGYGGIFKGSTAVGWNPPGGGEGAGNELPPEGTIFSRLFGIEKIVASLDTPGPVGLVAAGGYVYSGGFTKAGLGICALSGEKVRDVDSADGDFYEYCQDTIGSGANNYAGFFAGNVYLKEGSLQINDSLVSNSENLIYANAASAAAGSHLLKLQTAGVDKFLVDQEGNTTVVLPATGDVRGDGIKVTRGTGKFLLGQGTSDNNNFLPILSAKPVGNASFFIRGIQSDTQTTAEAFRFSASNSTEDGAIPGNELAMTFYNWATPLMSIMGDGKVGIGTLSPTHSLTVSGSARVTGSLKLDAGSAPPTCNAANKGVMYYFNNNSVLCVCNGSDWDSTVNGKTDNYCSNNPPSGG